MTAAVRNLSWATGINNYVPNCQHVEGLVKGQPAYFSLGSPAASDDDIVAAAVDADATAGTVETHAYTSDSPYGRNMILTISGDPGAATSVIDLHGFDWLGQPMVERFTVGNGITAIQYGKKAFYKTTKTVIITAATNAVTAKIGTGTRLGLPFKGDVSWAKEDGSFVALFKRPFWIERDRSVTDAAAGCSKWVKSPCPGYVKTLRGTPDGGGSTNDPVITVELGGTAITGLTVTIDTSDTAGTTVTDVPTTAGYSANNRLIAGSLIEIVGAAAASAKGDTVGVEIDPTQYVPPDTTDPATRTTGDPRGTYEALITLNGARKIEIGLMGDSSANSSNNGGLHGIRHYY